MRNWFIPKYFCSRKDYIKMINCVGAFTSRSLIEMCYITHFPMKSNTFVNRDNCKNK